MVKGRVIYFDFDRTLLDTDELKEEQARRIALIAELSLEQVNQGMKEYIQSLADHVDFSPEGYATYLAAHFGVVPSDVIKIYITDSNYIKDFLYPNTLSVLRKLKNRHNDLGIFSAAIPGHQRLKIERTGVLSYINPTRIIIEPRKLELSILSKLPEGAIVVDDDKQVILWLCEHAKQITPIWINRKTEELLSGVMTISDISELLTVKVFNVNNGTIKQ